MVSLSHPAIRNPPTISQRTKATQISKPVGLSPGTVASQAATDGSIWTKWPLILGAIAVVSSIAIGAAVGSLKYPTPPPLPPQAPQPLPLLASVVSIVPVVASAAIFRLGAGNSKPIFRVNRVPRPVFSSDLVPSEFMIMFPSGKVVRRKEEQPESHGQPYVIIPN